MYPISYELERLGKANLNELLKRRMQAKEASQARRPKRLERFAERGFQRPCTRCTELGDQTV